MIRSFADKLTADLFYGERPRRVGPDLIKAVRRKLAMLDAATRLEDLRMPPGNKLEALTGDRSGYHSIRVNDQWRLVFKWEADGPHEVEFVDYH